MTKKTYAEYKGIEVENWVALALPLGTPIYYLSEICRYLEGDCKHWARVNQEFPCPEDCPQRSPVYIVGSVGFDLSHQVILDKTDWFMHNPKNRLLRSGYYRTREAARAAAKSRGYKLHPKEEEAKQNE
ncbi:MAG: hypothetical protein FWF33_00570 [Clostridiales bacterium]|nr:hypothetical protein [Clostridiales bacterium]